MVLVWALKGSKVEIEDETVRTSRFHGGWRNTGETKRAPLRGAT